MSSTDARSLRAGLAILIATASLGPARAADVVFDPSVELSYSVDGNPDVVADEQVEPQSDEVAGVSADLVFRVIGQTTTSEFAYRPYYQSYADDSDRDNVGHRVAFELESNPGHRSKLRLAIRASRAERQGLAEDVGAPTTLVPRREIDNASVAVSQSIAAGRRLTWNWSLGGGATRYEDVEGSVVELEDSSEARLGVGFRHATTRKVAFGMDVTGERQSYDTREDTAVLGLQLALDIEAGKFTTWNLSAGAQRSETDLASRTSPSFGVAVSREVTRRSSLAAGARQQVSRGTGLSGPTTDLGVYLAWSLSPGRRWNLGTRVGYWEREEVELETAEPSTVESLVTTSSLSWEVGQHLSLGVQHEYRDQSVSSDVTAPIVADYHSGGIFLRMHLRGRDARVRQ